MDVSGLYTAVSRHLTSRRHRPLSCCCCSPCLKSSAPCKTARTHATLYGPVRALFGLPYIQPVCDTILWNCHRGVVWRRACITPASDHSCCKSLLTKSKSRPGWCRKVFIFHLVRLKHSLLYSSWWAEDTIWKESSTGARWTKSEQEKLEEADWKLSIPI